jgi:hypothetical protein
MKFQNREIRNAHSLHNHNTKVIPVVEAEGQCEGCEKPITRGQSVRWFRTFGIFHRACYGKGVTTASSTTTVVKEVDAEQVKRIVEAALAEMVTPEVPESLLVSLIDKAMTKRAPREIRVEAAGKKPKSIKNAHAMLEKLIFILGLRKHAYLYGPPGSGKSTGAMHAAEALSLDYGYISLNPQTPESRLLGYMDANGKYVASILYKLYKNGGVFCIDEMDNASAGLLTTLNSLLENGKGAFPCGIVDRHPDFIVVSTGNTAGRGGNMQFPERRAFDAAFAERFVYLPWGYDEAMERAIALGICPAAAQWIDWVQAVRKFSLSADPKLVISPRATFGIAEFLSCKNSPFTIHETLDAVLFKGIESERVSRILNYRPLPTAA